MTQEEKELLLKDLCGRLPYGVKLRYVEDLVVKKESHTITLNNIYLEHILNGDADIRPYLRPMSSITDEENELFERLKNKVKNSDGTLFIANCNLLQRFFHFRHIDNNHLIESGLALEAPEGMYKI